MDKNRLNKFLRLTKIKMIISIILYVPVLFLYTPIVLGFPAALNVYPLSLIFIVYYILYTPIRAILYPFMGVGNPFWPELNPYGYIAFLVLSLVYAYIIASILERVILRMRVKRSV